MASATVDIANTALVHLGAPLITALSDTSRQAVVMNQLYVPMRKKLLGNHLWNFAMTMVELSATANTPEYEYDTEFLLPSDVIRVVETDLLEDEPWEVQFNVDNNKVVVCNADSLKIKYIKDITDPSKYPGYFEDVFALLLAWKGAFAITQSRAMVTDMYSQFKTELREARSLDAQEAGRQSYEANEVIDVRW